MLILGLVLVVLSAVAAVLLIVDNTGGTAENVTLFGRDLTSVTVMEAFIAGMVVAAVFLLGFWMMLAAGRRARVNRAKYRAARKETKEVAAERDELAEQVRVEEERRQEPVGADSMATAPAGTPMQRTGDVNPGQPVGAPPQPRHAAPAQQPVITNIKPGDSPTR